MQKEYTQFSQNITSALQCSVINKYLRLILFKVIKPLFKMTEKQKNIERKYEQEKRVFNEEWEDDFAVTVKGEKSLSYLS
jgi:hypothetical protein